MGSNDGNMWMAYQKITGTPSVHSYQAMDHGQLGEDAFATAWGAGAASSLDAAIAEALAKA